MANNDGRSGVSSPRPRWIEFEGHPGSAGTLILDSIERSPTASIFDETEEGPVGGLGHDANARARVEADTDVRAHGPSNSSTNVPEVQPFDRDLMFFYIDLSCPALIGRARALLNQTIYFMEIMPIRVSPNDMEALHYFARSEVKLPDPLTVMLINKKLPGLLICCHGFVSNMLIFMNRYPDGVLHINSGMSPDHWKVVDRMNDWFFGQEMVKGAFPASSIIPIGSNTNEPERSY